MPAEFEHLDDEALVDRLQRAAFSYFERFTNPANGLVADTSLSGFPCSIAAAGFGLTAWPVAVERGWTSRSEALRLSLAAIRFFDTEAHTHRGFFYHFLDMQTGQRAWKSEISPMDTALLLAGMLTAASYFDGDQAHERELRGRVEKIAARINWPWLCDEAGLLRLGWKPGRSFLPGRWTGYSEALLMFVLGLGSSQALPPESFRTWLDTCQWSGGVDGYLHAGPLFIHLFPQSWLDLRGSLIPSHEIGWFENTQRAISAQRAYAAGNPNGFSGYGEDVWGLTACQGPKQRMTLRNGQRRWIAGYAARAVAYGPDDGTLAPWAPLACLPFAPETAMAATRKILKQYPQVIHDGMFADAFNPSVSAQTPAGWVAQRCTGIDQGLLVASIENHRSGLIWRLMDKSETVRRGLTAAGLKPQTMPRAAL